MARKTMRMRRKMRGGNPADANGSYEIGGYAASQQNAGSSASAMPDLNIINQAGGMSRKRKRRRQRGGMSELSPANIGGSTGLLPTAGDSAGEQKGGYFPSLFKSALAPFGLSGLNKYARSFSGKKVYMGKSRLSKRLRSHRNRR
jgi:hypothetical protein